MGKLNELTVMAYEPDPIPVGNSDSAKNLSRAINDLVKVVTWDDNDEAHNMLRGHLKSMARDLRGTPDTAVAKTSKSPAGKRRGRPPLTEEEREARAAKKAAKEAKRANAISSESAGNDSEPKRRRGRPPGSKNKKDTELDTRGGIGAYADGPRNVDGSGVKASGSDSTGVSDTIQVEIGADVGISSDEAEASTDGIF